ncbi:MAG: hypothetical protein LUG18_16195 [Candidatus Azobacteroides sp.]|nr:hypothetical protein [Candidatus Azobacteroides sp.]
MRKKIVKIAIGLFIVFLLFQFYFIFSNKGNLMLEISNTSLDIAQIEVYIDNKKVLDKFILNEGIHFYHKYSLIVSPINHTLIVKVGEDVSEEYKFNGLLFNWIVIEYHGDKLIDIDPDYNPFLIDFSKLPRWGYVHNLKKNINLALK